MNELISNQSLVVSPIRFCALHKAAIKGKTVQQTNKMPRDSGLITHVPPSIIERYGMVTLGIDVIHIISTSVHSFSQSPNTSNTFSVWLQEIKPRIRSCAQLAK